MPTLRRLSYFGLVFLPMLVLAACGGGDDGGGDAVKLPSPGQYQFDVTATMDIELVEELVSAAPVKGQPSQTVDLSGIASFDIGPSGGTFSIPEFGISGTIKLQVGDKVIVITLNPDQPSTGRVEPDGMSLNLFLDFEVQDPSTGSVIVGGYLFPVGTTDEPVPLEGRDVDFFRPLILQFPPDLGRVSLTRTDTEETLGSVTAMALSFLQREVEAPPHARARAHSHAYARSHTHTSIYACAHADPHTGAERSYSGPRLRSQDT
ncbi:MAG: hypothetical protein IIA91_07015 [Chloroflexi bacterium]|nr:hypothetical protein [Chloroflexota bacterium]